jgi:hypothetical protein
VSFLQCVFILFRNSIHKKNPLFLVSGQNISNMTDSKMFSDSNVIQNSSEFLCTICEADINMVVEFYGDIEKKDKVLPLEYALFVERVRLKTKKSQEKKIQVDE